MTIPAHREVDLAFLLEIVRASRVERPVEVCARIPQHFPDLTPEDEAITRRDGKTKLFENMIHWARNNARERGFLRRDLPPGAWEASDTAERGLLEELQRRGASLERAANFVRSNRPLPELLGPDWAASKRGTQPPSVAGVIRPRRDAAKSPLRAQPEPLVFESIDGFYDDETSAIRKALLARLSAMEGYEFEHLVARILDAAGLRDSQITGRSGDEGVDVMSKLSSPFVTASVAVQVKRHASNVGPKDVSYLRDRWARRADKLLFITTSDFTPGAREVAAEERQVTLINGMKLVEIMFEYGIGLQKKPRLTYELDEEFFSG